MIRYLATHPHTYTIERYLESLGKAMAARFRVATYTSLFSGPRLDFDAQPGTYIFSDIERMFPPMAQRAAQAWNMISELGGDARLLNHPTRSMRRYELLRTLFEHGDNTFNAYRLVECRRPQRWPVFIRDEHQHTKNLTPLLHFPEQLDARVAEILARGDTREDKLVVEFCDTRDDQGLYYKYSAFLIGERVIARDMNARRHWALGGVSDSTPELLEKERRYIETNPHERQVREIFRLARIDYGKIDYSMLDDRLQVWEINTNPSMFSRPMIHVMSSTNPADARRKALLRQLVESFAEAFAEIDVRDAS